MSYKYDCLSHCVGEHTDNCVAYNDKREAYQREPYRWSEKGTPMNSNQNTGNTQTNVSAASLPMSRLRHNRSLRGLFQLPSTRPSDDRPTYRVGESVAELHTIYCFGCLSQR